MIKQYEPSCWHTFKWHANTSDVCPCAFGVLHMRSRDHSYVFLKDKFM